MQLLENSLVLSIPLKKFPNTCIVVNGMSHEYFFHAGALLALPM